MTAIKIAPSFLTADLGRIADEVRAARDEEKQRRAPISEQEQTVALKLVADLEVAFAPLTALFGDRTSRQAAEFARAHAEVAEALARDERGSPSALWQGDAGEALALLQTATIVDAYSLAERLEEYNRRRFSVEAHVLEQTRAQIAAMNLKELRGIVVAADAGVPGVLGIVASRLVSPNDQ